MRHLLRSSLFALALAGALAHAQVEAPETSVGEALRHLASRSGVAFVGQVIRIDRTDGFVDVVFRVDQPILGAAGSTCTLRQWSGLWPPGMQRFYVSERALIFLHAPTASGFSSAVDGMDGIVPVIPQGADRTPLLDVRRLDARILRANRSRLPGSDQAALSLPDATTVVANWKQPAWREPQRRALPVSTQAGVAAQLLTTPTDSHVGR